MVSSHVSLHVIFILGLPHGLEYLVLCQLAYHFLALTCEMFPSSKWSSICIALLLERVDLLLFDSLLGVFIELLSFFDLVLEGVHAEALSKRSLHRV